jgi:hypothetical protein
MNAPMSAPAMAAAAPVVHRPMIPSRPEFTPSGQREVSQAPPVPEAFGGSPNALGSSPNVLAASPNAPGSSPNVLEPRISPPAPAPIDAVMPPPNATRPSASIALPLSIAIVAGLVFVGELIGFFMLMAR